MMTMVAVIGSFAAHGGTSAAGADTSLQIESTAKLLARMCGLRSGEGQEGQGNSMRSAVTRAQSDASVYAGASP
jgi:hypothetical protein